MSFITYSFKDNFLIKCKFHNFNNDYLLIVKLANKEYRLLKADNKGIFEKLFIEYKKQVEDQIQEKV